MTAPRPPRQPEENLQVNVRPWRRPALLVATLLCVSVLLLPGDPALSPAQAADDSQETVSASPSDAKPPAPQQPATDETKPSRESQCNCHSGCKVVRCRRGKFRIRLLRRCRPRHCCCCTTGADKPKPDERAPAPEKPDPYAWKDLFDGKTLEGWKTPNFGGEGKVYVEDGKIVIEMGEAMTGVTFTGDVPRDNFELEYEGIRLEGADFFATVTFPVGKDEASLVTGGWGGTVVGISCIDYYDASDNLTTTFQDFKDKQWYKFRVRITPAKIEAWIGDEQVVNQERKDHKIDIRAECDLCRPLGFASYVTTGAVRGIRIRKLKPPADREEPSQQK